MHQQYKTALAVGCLVGVIVAFVHVDKGGLERSTWPAHLEFFYSGVGIAVIVSQLNDTVEAKPLTLLIASTITTYHAILAVEKASSS